MAGPKPQLRRLSITTLHDKTSFDRTQVPMVGAQIDFYRQGATVKTGKSIAGGADDSVDVLAVGALLVNETVKVGVSGPTLTVVSIVTASNPPSVATANMVTARFMDRSSTRRSKSVNSLHAPERAT